MPFRLAADEVEYLIREVTRRSPAYLARRGRDELRSRLRGAMASLGTNPYRARLQPGASDPPRILGVDSADTLDRYRRDQPERIESILHEAERNADRRFEVLSVPVVGDPVIDWHRDYASGEAWPVRFHTAYGYGELLDLSRPTDVKVPWELSRLQFLPRLALAYRLTARERYVVAARTLLQEWDGANPVGYGINWTVGMEAALRAISIVLTADLLAGTDGAEHFGDDRVTEMLAEHGRFLHRNVEYSDVNGNHFTACLLGLLYLGARVHADPESPSWRNRARSGLEQAMAEQVHPDGVCHEGSIPYHGLVTELFLHAALVARRIGIGFGEQYLERLGAMLEFLRACTKPSGQLPIWGDTDDGRVFSFGGDMPRHRASLLALGAGLLDRPELWIWGESVPPEAALMLGPRATRALRADGAVAPDAAGASVGAFPGRSVAFRDGGFFLLRSGDDYCLVDCGDVGLRGRGGHGHNDALSVEMVIAGHDVLVDTGNSSYTRSVEERVACLSVRAHNAVALDGQEPAAIDTSRIARPTACPTTVRAWDAAAGSFSGRHHGYASLPGVDYYERTVAHRPDDGAVDFRIEDLLAGEGRHRAAWSLHLAPCWKPSPAPVADRARFLLEGDDAPVLEIRWRVAGSIAAVKLSPVYPGYGVRRERACLFVETEAELPFRARFDFRLLADAEAAAALAQEDP